MVMPPWLRKFVLTVHVVSSVGWLGAALTFVGLALTATTSRDGQTARAAILVMEPVGWYVLLPLVLTSLATGIIQGLGSTWGLIRHYWVLFKLVIGAVSSYVFVMFLLTSLGPAISGASDPATPVEKLQALAGTPRDHALLALAGLVTATVLAVYKPRGLTRYGRRSQEKARGRKRAGVPAMAMSTVAAGPDGGQDPASAGHPDSGPGSDGTTRTRRGGRYWLKAAGFILGVVVWGLLVRVALGSGPGDTGGHGGGTEPSTVTPGVNQQQEPDGGGEHVPPSGIPSHGG